MSRLITNAIRSTSATTDAITMDGSGNVTFPANATCSGTATGFGGGKILQVVSVLKTDQFSVTNTSYTDITGLSLSITASSSSNNFFVMASVFAACSDAALLRILKDSTNVGSGTVGSQTDYRGFAMVRMGSSNHGFHYGINFLNTAGDTNAHTFKIQAMPTSGSDAIKINRRGDDGNYSLSSSLTVMEVAA